MCIRDRACLLCLALAWSGLGLSCLSCLSCWTRPRQGRQDRQDRPRPDQAKARHNKQASQAHHCCCLLLNPENCQISKISISDFNPPGSGGRWWPLLRRFLYNQVLGRGLMGSWLDSGLPLARSGGHILTKYYQLSSNAHFCHKIFAMFVKHSFFHKIFAILTKYSPWKGPWEPWGGP